MNMNQASGIALDFLHLELGDGFALFDECTEFQYGWIFNFERKAFFQQEAIELKQTVEGMRERGVEVGEIEKNLTEIERNLLSCRTPAIGRSLIFVDMETGTATFVLPPQEAAIEEINYLKTNVKFNWQLRLKTTSPKEILPSFKELKGILNLNSTALARLIKGNKPIFQSKDIREFFEIKRMLESLGIECLMTKILD